MSAQLDVESTWWARRFNVEMVWCWLPTAETALDGTLSVAALGNDGIGVHIILDADEEARADPYFSAQLQMIYLGKALTQVRREEMAVEPR